MKQLVLLLPSHIPEHWEQKSSLFEEEKKMCVCRFDEITSSAVLPSSRTSFVCLALLTQGKTKNHAAW